MCAHSIINFVAIIVTIIILSFASMLPAVGVVRTVTLPPGIVNQAVRCFTTLSCDPSDPGMTSTTTSQCCLSERGVAYNVPGTEVCEECLCK